MGIKGYVRYVDEFLGFSDDKRRLAAVREEIKYFLESLRLRLHPTNNFIFPVREGIRFLGYRELPTQRLPVKENVRRFRRRVRQMQRDDAAWRVSDDWLAVPAFSMTWMRISSGVVPTNGGLPVCNW